MVPGPPSPEYFVTSRRFTGWGIHGDLDSRALRVSVLETCNTPALPGTLHDVEGTLLLPPPRPCRARGLLLSPPSGLSRQPRQDAGRHVSSAREDSVIRDGSRRVDVSCFNQTAPLAWNDMIRGSSRTGYTGIRVWVQQPVYLGYGPTLYCVLNMPYHLPPQIGRCLWLLPR